MKETILQSWQDAWPVIKSAKPLTTGEGVIDENAFNTIEVDKVFDAVNYAATTVGQAFLYRSLTQPSYDINRIQAKQQAVEEIKNHQALKANIEQILQHAATGENNFYMLLFGSFIGSFGTARGEHEIEGYGYAQYKRGIRFMLELADGIQRAVAPESGYLKDVFGNIKSFAETREYSLMKGPVYITEGVMQSKEEKKGLFPVSVIFKPRLFKPLIFIILAAILALLPSAMSISSPAQIIFFAPLLLVYFPIVGGYDRDNCIIPLRNQFKNSEAVGQALDALGQLDELLCFVKFAEAFGGDTVMPKLVDAPHHRINLAAAKNPVLGKANPNYVGNDFVLDDEKLILITGPNSGGKTAFCKTVTQIQLLAQIGCYVPAKAATLTVADKIFYQAPEISHLVDGEGRFGTELKRTKDIFVASSPKSLVVLDEMSEGTTFEEKLESSSNILNGFYRKGNSTILITHNHQLVDNFVNQGIGVPKQVEFAHDEPTYRLIPGISRVSHADRIAKKIGFSKEDIESYLTDKK
ncbi:MAG: MutS-related protein [Gammaproteobacteria bacterium]